MIAVANPLVLLLAIPLLGITILVRRHAYANLSPRRSRFSLAIRLIILSALVLSLAGARVRLPQSRQAVVVVADLSASDSAQRTTVQSLINRAAGQRPSGDTMGVVSVGRQPVVDQPAGPLSGFSGFQASVDPQYTNLAGGLDLANALAPAEYQHRIVLMSDGQQNIGDALTAARLLHSQGVRVDVVPVLVPTGPEVRVDQVGVPAELRPRESFALTVLVHSTIATTTGITLVRNQSVIGARQVPVHRGENRYVFNQSPLPPGSYTYRVEINPARDTQPENNQGSAFTSVQSAPRVLVITNQPREAANVMASLHSTGIQAVLRAPAGVTPDLATLQRYAAILIVDTPADVLGPQLMTQLIPYVRDLGRGLGVIGGENSYSMGGYAQTPLEQVLPVSMSLPKRQSMPTVAVALIIESLEEDTQVNISKEAGKGVVDLLTAQDQVAVNDAPFDESAGWVVPMQHVRNKGVIDAAIDRMVPGDPDTYTPALQAAYQTLEHTSAKIKHIILLGDGDAEDPSYQDVVQRIHAAGITVSTVGTNGLGRSDQQTMQNIATWGGGRYYAANDPAQIPQIFLREARTVARVGIVQGKFYPQELSANPMVRDVRQVAPLYGYIATTPKLAAEIVLASNKLDPVLAAWQFGLGRSFAWTSDASGLWTKDWLRMPGANRFWANLVSWVLPAAGSGKLFINASSSQGQGHISVSVPAALGPSPSVTARILTPGLGASTVQLEPSAPGEFGGSFDEAAQGAYFVTVEAHGAGHGAVGQIGMDAPYSPEYRTTGDNPAFLHALATAGGGSVITRAQDFWRANLPPVLADYDPTVWLLLLAVFLLPLDIAVRRLIVSRKELAAIGASLPFRRAPAPDAVPAVPLFAALQARRTRSGVPGPSTAPGFARMTRPDAVEPLSSEHVFARRATPAGHDARAPVSVPAREPVPDTDAPGDSLASRLLAAKQKKG